MKRLGICLGLAVSVWLLLTSLVFPVVAQSKSVVVQRRDADMTILVNGDVQVVEAWEVQFSGGPFTSAFRSIPLNRVTNIDGWSVADETQSYQPVNKGSNKQPYTFEYSSGDGLMKATWFFPPTTDQTRTFKVIYTLHGALWIDPAGDQFYWKFIEADRGYTINSSQVVLHLPAKFDSNQLNLSLYQNGAEQSGARRVDAQTLEFTGGPFAGGVEEEIRAQFPHGVVTASPPAWQANANQLPSTPKPQPIASSSQNQASARTSQDNSIFPIIVVFLVVIGLAGLLRLTGLGDSDSSDSDNDSSDYSRSSSRSSWPSRSSSSSHSSSSGNHSSGGSSGGGSGGGGGSSGFG